MEFLLFLFWINHEVSWTVYLSAAITASGVGTDFIMAVTCVHSQAFVDIFIKTTTQVKIQDEESFTFT